MLACQRCYNSSSVLVLKTFCHSYPIWLLHFWVLWTKIWGGSFTL